LSKVQVSSVDDWDKGKRSKKKRVVEFGRSVMRRGDTEQWRGAAFKGLQRSQKPRSSINAVGHCKGERPFLFV
jgi:hypothetical protein